MDQDQVIRFNKTLQQRLMEYKDVFYGNGPVPASAVTKEWSYYLDCMLDPNGWQAIWKIPRHVCEELDIPFPTMVLVFVLGTDLDNLSALVRIIAVQDDDIHLPEKYNVPLIQLWPTKDQDKTVGLNLKATANAIDMLRVFYLHLFMPWENEDDECDDWKSTHLEPRLELYYDLIGGALPKHFADRFFALLSEARRLKFKCDKIQTELLGREGESVGSEVGNCVEDLAEIYLRFKEIKNEVDIFENPVLRKAHLKKFDMSRLVQPMNRKVNWLVHKGNTSSDEYIRCFKRLQELRPNQLFTVTSDLKSVLEVASPNDVYFLYEGNHVIKSSGVLESGGEIQGVFDREKTLISCNIDEVMLDFQGDFIHIENVTIEASRAQYAVVVRGGKTVLTNCCIVGDGKLSTHQGVIVLNGGQLELINCDIRGFSTALIGNSGAKIYLNSTSIHDVNVGIKIYDKCILMAEKSKLYNCKEYGICLETEDILEEGDQRTGDFESLQIVPEVTTDSLSGNNNRKADVLIRHKSKLHGIENLLETDDPTICDPSEDEMEVGDETNTTTDEANITAVENKCISPATI